MSCEFRPLLSRLREGDIVIAIFEVPSSDREICPLRWWLSGEERRRADQFCFERDRIAYVGAHALLGALVSGLLGARGTDWELCHAWQGSKPYISSNAVHGLRVNLSHTDGLAAVVMGLGGEVGIDVERVGHAAMPSEEMLDLLAPPERDLLQGGSARERSFLRFWTRKEACLKALGLGLSIAPRDVDTSDNMHFLIQGAESQVWPTDLTVGTQWVGCACSTARPVTIHNIRADLRSLGRGEACRISAPISRRHAHDA